MRIKIVRAIWGSDVTTRAADDPVSELGAKKVHDWRSDTNGVSYTVDGSAAPPTLSFVPPTFSLSQQL